MRCPETEWLVDLLYDEVESEERSRLLAHIEQCGECLERWARLCSLSAAAERWTAPQPPRGIAERAIARVASERAREAGRSWADRAPAQLLPRLVLGAGAAVVSLLLVIGVAGRQVTPLAIGVLGVVWTVLYAGLFLSSSHSRLRPIARAALAASGVALILVPPLSIPSVVEACARLVQAAPESVSFSLLLLLVAAGYTAGPLFVGAVAFGEARSSRRPKDGATLSLLYALLVAPAIYLQCVALPLDVTALWMAGALIGAAASGPLGLRAATWLRPPVVN